MIDLHKLHKDDPEKFDEASRLYIKTTADELKKNGFGEYSGDFITNSTALMTQHSNKLKLNQFNDQEEKANQTARILVNEGIASSYQLRLNGKIEEADNIDLVNVANLNDLINEDAINSPAYKELISQIKVNKKQSTLELSIRTMGNNGFAMAALSRAMTTGKITSQDAGLLNAYKIDQAYIDNVREDLSLTEKTKINSWLATTKGKFATAGDGLKKQATLKALSRAWLDGKVNMNTGSTDKNLDLLIGQDFGMPNGMTPDVLGNLNKDDISQLGQFIKANAILPKSVKTLLNTPSVALTLMKNYIDNGKPELAEKVGANVINLMTIVGDNRGINEKQLALLTHVKNRVEYGGLSYSEAFQKSYQSKQNQIGFADIRKNKILSLDSKFEDKFRSNETAWIKSQLKKIFPDDTVFTRNNFVTSFKDLLELDDVSIDSITETLTEIKEKLFITHDSNFDLTSGKTGESSKGSIATFYKGENLENAEVYIDAYLKSFDFNIDGEPLELGTNAFLLAVPRNSTEENGQARWTVVDKDGLPINDNFGTIAELHTRDINKYLKDLQVDKTAENKAEATLKKGWFETLGLSLVKHHANLKESKEYIDFEETTQSGLGQTMVEEINPNQLVERPSDLSVVVGKGVDKAKDFAVETFDKSLQNVMIVHDASERLTIKALNSIKALGTDVLRTNPAFIEMSQAFKPEFVEELLNSFKAKKPFDANKHSLETLKDFEGFNPYQYPDGKGFSIGYGFLISSLEPDERSLIADINKITRAEADAVLQLKVLKISTKLRQDVPNFETLSAERQAGIINFAYQLGYENVTAQGPNKDKNWPKFFDALKRASNEPWNSEGRNDAFELVAKNMMYNFGSKGRSYTTWFNQTPGRAKDVIKMIRGY